MKPVTKWNARIHDPEIIPEAVRKAFAVAEREKPGATHLELPDDVMEAQVAGAPVPRRARPLVEPVAGELHRAAELLQAAERPVILAGQRRRPPERVGGAAPLLPADRPERDHDVHGQGRRSTPTTHTRSSPPACAPRTTRAASWVRPTSSSASGYDLVEWSPVAWNPRSDRRIICIDTVAGRDRRALRPRRRADGRHRAHPHPPRQPRLGQAAGPGRGARPTRDLLRSRARARAPTTASRSSRSGRCATCAT